MEQESPHYHDGEGSSSLCNNFMPALVISLASWSVVLSPWSVMLPLIRQLRAKSVPLLAGEIRGLIDLRWQSQLGTPTLKLLGPPLYCRCCSPSDADCCVNLLRPTSRKDLGSTARNTVSSTDFLSSTRTTMLLGKAVIIRGSGR